MLIRCPQCKSTFNLKREFVPLDKRLRCGACLEIFTLGDEGDTTVIESKSTDSMPDDEVNGADAVLPRGVDLTDEEFELQDDLESADMAVPTSVDEHRVELPPLSDTQSSSGLLWTFVLLACCACIVLLLLTVESPMVLRARAVLQIATQPLLDLGVLAAVPAIVLLSLVWVLVRDRLPEPEAKPDDSDELDLLDTASKKPQHRLVGGLLVMTLVLLGVAQLTMVNAEKWSTNLRYRPAIAAFCAVIDRCTVAELKDIEQIQILSKSVVSHPEFDNVLLVTINFANEAPFAQDYPKVKLSFLNYRGEVITQRVFNPEEYLPDQLYYAQELQPGTPVQSHLRIVDPGKEAVNYRFELL